MVMKEIQNIAMLTPTASKLIQFSGAIPGFAAFQPAGILQTTSTALGAGVSPSAAMMGTLASLRGGSTGAFNSALESQHMGVLSSYGVVTVLVLNSALVLYLSTKYETKDGAKYDWVKPFLFHLISGVCVLSGTFTGVMFQLLNIYSKTALSMGNEAGYLAFKAATAKFRKLGFYTFLTCLGTFTGTFVLSFYEKVKDDGRLGNYFKCFIGMLALAGIFGVKIILNGATTHIFTPEMGFS